MGSELQFAVSEVKGAVPVTVLRLKGDLDGKTYTGLEAKANELIEAGTSNLLIDMSGVGFMGSAGLRALHGVHNRLKTAGPGGGAGQLKLLKPSDAAKRVFKTLGFDKYFSVYEDLESALNSF